MCLCSSSFTLPYSSERGKFFPLLQRKSTTQHVYLTWYKSQHNTIVLFLLILDLCSFSQKVVMNFAVQMEKRVVLFTLREGNRAREARSVSFAHRMA